MRRFLIVMLMLVAVQAVAEMIPYVWRRNHVVTTVVNDNSIAIWQFTSNNTPYADTSFIGTNVLSLYGGASDPTYVSGPNTNSCLYFSGANKAYCNAGTITYANYTTASSFSASCWLKYPNSSQQSYVMIPSSGNMANWGIFVWTNTVGIAVFSANATKYRQLSVLAPPTNMWVWLCAVAAGTNLTFYTNAVACLGSLMDNGYTNMPRNAYPIMIGSRQDSTTRYTGYLDDARIYTNALTASQITNIYLSTTNGHGLGD